MLAMLTWSLPGWAEKGLPDFIQTVLEYKFARGELLNRPSVSANHHPGRVKETCARGGINISGFYGSLGLVLT